MSNNARSRDARAYMRTHPGTKYTEALRAVSGTPMPASPDLHPAAATPEGKAQIEAMNRLGRFFPDPDVTDEEAVDPAAPYVLGVDHLGQDVEIDPNRGHTMITGDPRAARALFQFMARQAEHVLLLSMDHEGAPYLTDSTSGHTLTDPQLITQALLDQISQRALTQRTLLGVDFTHPEAAYPEEVLSTVNRALRLGRSYGVHVSALTSSTDVPGNESLSRNRSFEHMIFDVHGGYQGAVIGSLTSGGGPTDFVAGKTPGQAAPVPLSEIPRFGPLLISGAMGAGKTVAAASILHASAGGVYITQANGPGAAAGEVAVVPVRCRIRSLQELRVEVERRTAERDNDKSTDPRLVLPQHEKHPLVVVLDDIYGMRSNREVMRLAEVLLREGLSVRIHMVVTSQTSLSPQESDNSADLLPIRRLFTMGTEIQLDRRGAPHGQWAKCRPVWVMPGASSQLRLPRYVPVASRDVADLSSHLEMSALSPVLVSTGTAGEGKTPVVDTLEAAGAVIARPNQPEVGFDTVESLVEEFEARQEALDTADAESSDEVRTRHREAPIMVMVDAFRALSADPDPRLEELTRQIQVKGHRVSMGLLSMPSGLEDAEQA